MNPPFWRMNPPFWRMNPPFWRVNSPPRRMNPPAPSGPLRAAGCVHGRAPLLYCTVLYCTALHCTVLYGCAHGQYSPTVLYCTVLPYSAPLLYCTVLYCILLYCTVLSTGCAHGRAPLLRVRSAGAAPGRLRLLRGLGVPLPVQLRQPAAGGPRVLTKRTQLRKPRSVGVEYPSSVDAIGGVEWNILPLLMRLAGPSGISFRC
eukprot:6957825-Pyramimonas_sp.AAC.1